MASKESNAEKVAKIKKHCLSFNAVDQGDHEIRGVKLFNVLTELRSGAKLSDDDQVWLLEDPKVGLFQLLDNDTAASNMGSGASVIAQLLTEACDAAVEKSFTKLGRLMIDTEHWMKKKNQQTREARDTCETGLITCFESTPPKQGAFVVKSVVEYVLEGCRRKGDVTLNQMSARVLLALLKKFSNFLSKEQKASVLECLWQQTLSKDDSIRSNLPQAFGHIAASLDVAALQEAVSKLARELKSQSDSNELASLKLTLRILEEVTDEATGFGTHIKELAPLLFNIIDMDINRSSGGGVVVLTFDDRITDDDEAIELSYDTKASAINIFGSFIEKCPMEIQSVVSDIIARSIEFLSFNPNKASDDSGMGDGMEDLEVDDPWADAEDPWAGGGDDMFGEAEEENGGADDDNSWKVRQASADTLKELVLRRPELLKTLYTMCCKELVKRFTENVGVVTNSVLSCFAEMLKASLVIDEKERHGQPVMLGDFPAPPSLVKVKSATDQLLSMIHDQFIIKQIIAQLEHATVDTKAAMFSMLQVFFIVMKKKRVVHLIATEHLDSLTQEIVKALKTSNGSGEPPMKVRALELVQNMCYNISPATLAPLMQQLLPEVIGRLNKQEESSVKERALLTLKHALDTPGLDCAPFAKEMATGVRRIVKGKKALQPVRLAGVVASGSLLAKLGSHPAVLAVVSDILEAHLSRVAQDVFASPILRAFQAVATASPVVPGAEPSMAALEAKIIEVAVKSDADSQAVIQLERIRTLNVLAKVYGDKMKVVTDPSVMSSFARLVSQETSSLAEAVLRLGVTVQAFNKEATDALVLGSLQLVCSDIVRGGDGFSAPSAFFLLLESFVRGQVKGNAASFAKLMKACWGLHTTASTSRNLATIVAECAFDTGADAVAHAKAVLTKVASGEQDIKVTAINIIGILGSKLNLAAIGAPEAIREAAAANSKTEEVAATAYGNLAVGAMAELMPLIVKGLDDPSAVRFTLLALNQLLKVAASKSIAGFKVSGILAKAAALFTHEDEYIRNLAAGCVGLMLKIDANTVTPTLVLHFGAGGDDADTLQTSVLTAINQCVAAGSVPAALKANLDTFIQLSSQPLPLALATVTLVHSLVKANPACVRAALAKQVKQLASHISNREDLVTTVIIGMIKMKTDTGIPLRLAACQCISACMLAYTPSLFGDAEIVTSVFDMSIRDLRKSMGMELKSVIAAQFEMQADFAPVHAEESHLISIDKNKSAGIKEKVGILLRADRVFNKMCKDGKNEKIAQAIDTLVTRLADKASHLPKYQELVQKLSLRNKAEAKA